ncbi:MAG: beta-galactosidase [Armatimonadetes bacterium]|nr:beta-galactosidase [Armatimonadota bacterium]
MSWTPDADPTPEAATAEVPAPAAGAEDAAKPARRRRSPRARTETPPAAETEAPAAEAAPAPEAAEAAPARRRGRRKAAPPEDTPPAEERPTEVSDLPVAEAPAEAPAPRRRGRRKADAAETPVDLGGLVEGTPDEEQTPAPQPFDLAAPPADIPAPPELGVGGRSSPPASGATRRGRRRTTQPEAAPPELAEGGATLPDVEAPVAEESAEEGEARGRRRGRRSRRRRGQEDVILEPVDLTEMGTVLPDETATAEAEEETVFVPPPSTPVYAAPPLVPPVLPLPAGASWPRTTATLRPDPNGGLARITINDDDHAPFLFFVNAETAERGEVVDAQIRLAAASGVHLYSGVMYLPLRNAYGDRSFGAIDALVQQVLASDSDGYLLPRLQFVPTNFWARTHPDQMARYADGSEGDVSLASPEFWADCVDALEALIAHLSDSDTPGGDRVIGFHLDRGEWFYDAQSGPDLSPPNREAFQNWLRAKYQATYALRAAWFDGSVTFEEAEIPLPAAQGGKKGHTPLYAGAREGRWVDYAQFSSDIVAQVITGLASAVKTLSAGRMLVAVSYGYTLEFATRNDSGHLAMARVLASPDVDIVAGPNAYSSRGAGGTGAFGALVDSVALHGKLWLVEDDTKTWLAEAETPDTYNPKIAGETETQAIHQRQFGAALTHRAGVTWMDLWGQGWLNRPDIWEGLRALRAQADLWGRLTAGRQAPDVAVLVDEASLAYLKNDPHGLGQHLIGKTRDLLLRAGASVGFYLQSDVTQADFPDSKLYLFLNALRVTTAERQAIREKLQRRGKTLAWLYAPAVFDEKGAATQESSEVVGMVLRLQPWNARLGSQITEARHPITERLRNSKRVGQDEVINPSYAVSDPQATVLAEYQSNGAPSLAVREHPGGWKSVFFGDPHLTVELLRGLYHYADVPICDSQDDIAYVGDGALLVHAPFTGQRTLWLPQRATVYDAAEHRIIGVDTRSFRAFLRARTTRLFLWGEREAVQAATGLPLPSGPEPLAVPEPPALSEPVTLPEPPPSPSPIAPPRSESAAEIAARYERQQLEEQESGAAGGVAETPAVTLQVSDLAAVLEMPEAADEADSEVSEADNATTEGQEARPRSRWQRRRAAARARREAERQARLTEGAPESGSAANPPLDIAALLPDLPPRRPSPNPQESLTEPEARAEEDRELPS